MISIQPKINNLSQYLENIGCQIFEVHVHVCFCPNYHSSVAISTISKVSNCDKIVIKSIYPLNYEYEVDLTVVNQDPLLSLILNINTVKITIKSINTPLKVNKYIPSIKCYVNMCINVYKLELKCVKKSKYLAKKFSSAIWHHYSIVNVVFHVWQSYFLQIPMKFFCIL